MQNRLSPSRPPGRANRKALAFVAEIQRLRAGGYSFSAIQLALLDAGLQVSVATVKREASKATRTAANAAMARTAAGQQEKAHDAEPASAAAPTVTAPGSPGNAFYGDPRSGKDIAAAFMRDRITNPLIQEAPP